MTEITVPDQALIVDKSWTLNVPAQANRSSWSGATKIIGIPGPERWKCSARLRVRSREVDKRPWRAFFVALRGVQNTFQLRAACQQRTGSNPTVTNTPGTGYTVPLTGLPLSQTVLVAGQYMTVPLPSGHKRLVCLTANLVSNGSGNGTATFEPALNQVPAVGATVETINPYALVRMTESEIGWMEEGGLASFLFDVEEAN